METKTLEVTKRMCGVLISGTVQITKNEEGLWQVDTSSIDFSAFVNGEDTQIEFEGIIFGSAKDLLSWYALAKAGIDDYGFCQESGFAFPRSRLFDLDVNGNVETVNIDLCWYVENLDRWYLRSKLREYRIRTEEGIKSIFYPAERMESDYYYCHSCGCWVSTDFWDYEYDCCLSCAEKNYVIEEYVISHQHNKNPHFFGADAEGFKGIGFELEVETREDRNKREHSVYASKLIEASGLEEDEVRFAYDGSIPCGFEIISEPHTVKEFWKKTPQWEEMLKYLTRSKYISHDSGRCGLHVHVSRNLLGKTKEEQDSAISKIYAFFDENWDALVKISRRTHTEYCEKVEIPNSIQNCLQSKKEKLTEWKKAVVKNRYWLEGHHIALNNCNLNTFEFRLGRGTLNSWSYFSWIDLIITISNNSRRITNKKVETNDTVSWLAGIKESTAKYILKQGVFEGEMYALYPSLKWEKDTADSVLTESNLF